MIAIRINQNEDEFAIIEDSIARIRNRLLGEPRGTKARDIIDCRLSALSQKPAFARSIRGSPVALPKADIRIYGYTS